MGLDIVAYSKLVSVPEDQLPEDVDSRYEDFIHAYAYASFPHSVRGLPNADVIDKDSEGGEWIAESWFKETPETETFSFRAGSYTGYGAFRERLAELVGTTPSAVWAASEPLVDLPFYELINFADNEGVIGPDAAKDLLADFREYQDSWRDEIIALGPHGQDYYHRQYENWIRAFELAADGGLVCFH